MAAAEIAAGEVTHGPLAAIREQFPAWRPWRSDHGGYMATRRRTRWPADPPPGYAMTVCADTEDGLRQELAAQEAHAVPG